jgi:lysophospholipase
MKRHSEGFDKALHQLHTVIENVVLSAAIDADDNHKRLPMILCAHSMGGNFALRYLAEYNKTSHNQPIFTCAAFTSPMFGIYAVNVVPPFVRIPLLKFLSLAPTAYVPNGCDWFDGYRERPGLKGIFSSDLERFALQRAYFTHPDYQFLVTGSPTNKWLRDALASCRTIQQKDYVENITTPVFIGIAGQDRLIQNSAIWDVVKRLKNGESLEIPESQHEILMERNPIRQQFVERFFTFIEENVLNKPDKGKTYIQ